jgi:Protein of unknown function (DUF3306)
MTGPDHGDEDKGFLARWSQRKQEAKQPEPKPEEPAPAAENLLAPVAEAEAVPEFDLSSLPKLEEMTGATDISVFLQKGVPEHLRNAALQKSWAMDPAIRNYVNPALEYAYDWNTPGGVPGSSELDAGLDVAGMVLQIMGDGSVAEPSIAAVKKPDNEPGDPEPKLENVAAPAPQPELPEQALRLSADPGVSVASVTGTADTEALPSQGSPAAPQQAVRRHGSAKPFD